MMHHRSIISLIALISITGCAGRALHQTSESIVASGEAQAGLAPLSDAVKAAVDEAIQDEYRARETYQKVIADFGQAQPFIRISEAEARHITELSALYTKRGLPVPASSWNSGNVPSYDSLRGACRASAAAERETVEMYNRLLEQELPEDVRAAFERVRDASLNSHLPSFVACAVEL